MIIWRGIRGERSGPGSDRLTAAVPVARGEPAEDDRRKSNTARRPRRDYVNGRRSAKKNKNNKK